MGKKKAKKNKDDTSMSVSDEPKKQKKEKKEKKEKKRKREKIS
jgi:hypothetical protein